MLSRAIYIISFLFLIIASQNSFAYQKRTKFYVELGAGGAVSGIQMDKIQEDLPDDEQFKNETNYFYYAVSVGVLFPLSRGFSFGPEITYANGPTLKYDTKAEVSSIGNKPVTDGKVTYEITNEQLELLLTSRFMINPKSAFVVKFGAVQPLGKQSVVEVGDTTSTHIRISNSYDIKGIVPKLYLGFQYGMNKNVYFGFFVSTVFGSTAKDAEEFEDMWNVDDDDKTRESLKTPAVLALGLSLTSYF